MREHRREANSISTALVLVKSARLLGFEPELRAQGEWEDRGGELIFFNRQDSDPIQGDRREGGWMDVPVDSEVIAARPSEDNDTPFVVTFTT